jgi:hypothetical protein
MGSSPTVLAGKTYLLKKWTFAQEEVEGVHRTGSRKVLLVWAAVGPGLIAEHTENFLARLVMVVALPLQRRRRWQGPRQRGVLGLFVPARVCRLPSKSHTMRNVHMCKYRDNQATHRWRRCISITRISSRRCKITYIVRVFIGPQKTLEREDQHTRGIEDGEMNNLRSCSLHTMPGC